EKIDRGLEAFVNGRERILVLDADDVVIAGQTQCADDALPFELVVAPADAAEQPRTRLHLTVALDVEDAVDRNVLPVEGEVLRVDVKDRVAERADGGRNIDTLPVEVTRVKVDAEIGTSRRSQLQHGLRVVDEEARVSFEGNLQAVL